VIPIIESENIASEAGSTLAVLLWVIEVNARVKSGGVNSPDYVDCAMNRVAKVRAGKRMTR
jgi:hypothetical protein